MGYEKQGTVAHVMQEWLVTNDLGSFAMGIPQRLPRRKYHGLLTFRTPQWNNPHHLFSEVNEILHLDGETFQLGAFSYQRTNFPRGYMNLEAFSADPCPCWTYICGDTIVKRSLMLHPKANVVKLTYEFENLPENARLELHPYLTGRDYHQLQAANNQVVGDWHLESDTFYLSLYKGFPDIFMKVDPKPDFDSHHYWNRAVIYEEERERGYAFREDLFVPGSFELSLEEGTAVHFTVGLAEAAGRQLRKKKAVRRESLEERFAFAANQFCVEPREGHMSVIAGYPWQGESGRDTFIALSGLTLHHPKLAYRILESWGRCMINGMIPNQLSIQPLDSDVYAIDASLWYIRAIQQLEMTMSPKFIEGLEDGVFRILQNIREHRFRPVHLRPTGLLYASSKPKPLHWMNVVVDGLPVTARSPFAVELNALFYNAIRYAIELAERRNMVLFIKTWMPIVDQLAKHFVEMFWLEEEGFLADAHNGLVPDTALRPNQIIALGLPNFLLSKEQGLSALAKVRAKLLTPYGLRTLSPEDPEYRGSCGGHEIKRSLALHQGAVWPWLLGPYFDAVLRLEGPERAKREIDSILENFKEHLDEACTDQVSMIFEGNSPHLPCEAPASAINVGELLRIIHLRKGL